jgi:hypothetical protein
VCVRAEREKWFTLMELQKEKEMEGCSLVRLDVLLILMYTYEHIRLCMYILRLGSAQTTSSIRMLCFFPSFSSFTPACVCVYGDPAYFSLPPPSFSREVCRVGCGLLDFGAVCAYKRTRIERQLLQSFAWTRPVTTSSSCYQFNYQFFNRRIACERERNWANRGSKKL